jgi:photosystem II stability/assembly factor-like uncharacterized protein
MMQNILIVALWGLASYALQAQPLLFTPTGPGGGGYMYSPAIHPANPNQLFLVCDMGGVYHSANSGQTWDLIPFQQLLSQVKGQVQFTSDPQVMYSLHRSLTNTESPLFRGEIAKSTDGGQHWNVLDDPTDSGVHQLFADPNHSGRLLCSEYNRLFFSNNGGNSWTEVFHPADDQMWLGGVFWDGANIYVGTGKGLLVSKNNGQSFVLENHSGLPAGKGIFHLNGAKQSGVTRLFIISAQADQLNAWNNLLDLKPAIDDLYRMNYTPAANWVNTRNNIPQAAEIQLIDLAATSINTVYCSGEINGQPHLFKSTDGGNTWVNTFKAPENENIATGWGGDYGAFSYLWNGAPLGLEVALNNPDILVATDGYSHISTDGGASWRQLYVQTADQNPIGAPTAVDKTYRSSGLNVTTGHHIHWLSQTEIFAACTDIGNQYSADGGQSWSFARNTFYPWGNIGNPNWYRILQRPDNQHLYAAISELNDMYMGERLTDEVLDNTFGMVLHSADKGLHWDTLFDFQRPVCWLAMDENDPNRLYASVIHHESGGIYRSTDGGLQWERLPSPARTEGHPYNIRVMHDGGLVVTFSGRALADGVTLTESSGVFFSPDGGDTWYDRTPPAMRFYTKDLIIDPADLSQNTWFATAWGRFTTFEGPNNAGNGGVYRTQDRGLTWERIFEHERCESVGISPHVPGALYVCVEFGGLFYTAQRQAPQPGFNRVESFPFARPKRVFFNPYIPGEMWVTTMGGATWIGQEQISPVNETSAVPTLEGIFSPSENSIYFVNIPENSHFLSVFNSTGHCIFQKTGSLAEKTTLPDLPAGVWYAHIRDRYGRPLGQIRWIKH